MKLLKKTGIILLLLVFMTGSTGISILHHICSGSKTDHVTVYPEFFSHSSSACCADEETINRADLPVSFTATPCCKNLLSFFKLPVITVLSSHPEIPVNPFISFLELNPGIQILRDIPFPEKNIHFEFYSPPFYGRSLIHYLHQIKVPLPSLFA